MVREEDLDLVLVPLGLAVVAGYHLWLLYAILRHPTRTVVGLNALARKSWVAVIMANTEKNGVLAVQTLRNNIMASTVLATTAITLVSVISVFIGATAGRSPASPSSSSSSPLLVYGSKTEQVFAVKYLAISLCFMLAFVCNVQAIRLYAHASFLLGLPPGGDEEGAAEDFAAYVARTVNRGSHAWSLGSAPSTCRSRCSCGRSGPSRCSRAASSCAYCSTSSTPPGTMPRGYSTYTVKRTRKKIAPSDFREIK